MNLPPGRRWAILFVLIIAGIIAGALLSGIFSPGPAHNPDTGLEVPHNSTITSDRAYCSITEYGEMKVAHAHLVLLTADDFRDFPEFTKWMNGSTGSGTWYNGARTAGDFIDCNGRFPAFLNLSCRNLTPAECSSASKPSPDLFVHDGRYYSVSCLPGFGMAGHPGASANGTSPCP